MRSLFVLGWLVGTTVGATAAPPLCADGTFQVESIKGTTLPQPATIRLANEIVSTNFGCAPLAAKVRATRRWTTVKAKWASCGTTLGKVALIARIVRRGDCQTLRGVLTTPGKKRAERHRVRAARTGYDYDVPLDPQSPWPKFRRTAAQDARSPVHPSLTGGHLWSFPTGKGIFSTAVIGGDGAVYIGSADRYFYALNADGTERWKRLTGEIIDSSALLDDRGRLYVGSGDGRLYAFTAATGAPAWTFDADPPSTSGAFINWFEGNVAIGTDGTLYVPNDNFYTYAIDRETQAVRWRHTTVDQTWSLPAVDTATGNLFIGNNNLLSFLGKNTFALNPADGTELWSRGTDGTIAASPALTDDGAMVIGGFDGYVRAYEKADGALRWEYGARDHLYASPALLPDGTVIQASADGSVYALNPQTGAVRWQFDTRDAIRSSPAVDAEGHIYVGSGEGRLFVLNPDGTLRWSMRLINAARDDLNASPALGADAIIIAGETGEIFSVPYDYCLRPDTSGDSRCRLGPTEDLPDAGAHLFFTTQFGRQLDNAPGTIQDNQPLTFSLYVRSGGDTQLAHLDAASVQVTFDPPAAATTDVSGDRKFLTLIPTDRWVGPAGGTLSVRVQGNYLVNPTRVGLKFSGGQVGGQYDETFNFTIPAASDDRNLPLPVPTNPGDPAGTWEFSRIAAPLPTILPSYNQIGFDSIHYLVGLVEQRDADFALGWVVGARLKEGANVTEVDPATRVMFPIEVRYRGGLLTLVNQNGFRIEFNSIRLPFELFRASTRIDGTGAALESPHLNVRTVCSGITLYGQFLQQLGFCNPQTDLMVVAGGAELAPFGSGAVMAPSGVGTVAFAADNTGITATIAASTLKVAEHRLSVLAINAANDQPLPLDYGYGTVVTENPDGTVASVRVPFGDTPFPAQLRVYLMVDTYPAARDTILSPP